jgi:hypothetical protein
VTRLAALLTPVVLALGLVTAPAEAAAGPVMSLTCVSSLGVATLTDVQPASTQVVQLSAAAGDLIRCEASISGAYTSLQWRGPNDDYGSQPVFATSVGVPRFGGAPYDIGLTVNWEGNPLMAHVSVLPDGRAPVVIVTGLPGCIVVPAIPFGSPTPIVPAFVTCPIPGVPSSGTSTITVGY